jgi:hypothetical protein
MNEQDRKAKLAELDRESANLHARYMKVVCRELRSVPIPVICKLGQIVGGTTDYVGALRTLADMGPETAEIICSAATATLITECEARNREGVYE